MKKLFACAVLFALVGCKTSVYIETDPPGAEVYQGEKLLGVTPCTVKTGAATGLTPDRELLIKKAGYLPHVARLERYMTFYLVYKWSPTQFYIKLNKLEPPPPPVSAPPAAPE